MKHLALLAASVCMALLVACGDHNKSNTTTKNPTTQSQSDLNNANKDVNAGFSSDTNAKKGTTQGTTSNQ